MRPVPILLLARELDIGGSERQLTELARALDRSRFEVHAACFQPEGMRIAELESAGVPVHRIPLDSFANGSVLRGAAAFRRVVRANRIRLVHPFDYPTVCFSIPLARWMGLAAVSSQRAERAILPARYRRLLRWTDHWAHAVVVNSMFVQRSLIEHERVPAARVRLCYNGLDPARFPPAPPAAAPFRGGAAPVIGTVSALRPEKGVPVLLEAFARVHRTWPQARLLIVGRGETEPQLRRRAAELGVAGAMRIEPAAANVVAWLHSLDVFVLPSHSEAFSNSLMEAMACALPVVASRVGGNPELVADGETGFLFPPSDAAALAGRLLELLDRPELRARLACAASERIRRDFSLQRAAGRMGQIYESLLSARGSG
jgi:glycosyltransferase involved in cell wall biosynthesis